MKLNHLRPLALSAVALFASASAALAVDATDFATKFISAYTSSFPPNDKVTFGPATVNGNDITYDGVSMTTPSADTPSKLPTKFQFTGVTEAADGSYTADALTFPDVDYSFEGGGLRIKNLALKHIFVANSKTPTVLDSSRIFGEASLGPIVLTLDGTPALTIDSITISNSFKPSQGDPELAEIDSTGLTAGMKFDMTHAKDQSAVAQAKALGLETMTGKGIESLTWSLGDGHLNVSEVSIDVDKVGKLKFAFDITGYTPAFLQALSGASQALAGDTGDSAAQAQATAALLQAAQTLFINSASLRYDDASITTKLLEMFAKQAGVARPAFIDQLVTSMPAMDEDSSDPTPPAVMKMMQAATRAFLNDPRSMEIKLAPKTPLGVLGIAAAAMAPTDLANQIGLQINVNDKQITNADADKETGVAPAKPADDQTNDNGDNSSGTMDNGGSGDNNASDSSGDNSDTGGDRLSTPHSN